MKGIILYQCTGCDSFLNVGASMHNDDATYIECHCGEKCEAVDSPADLIVDVLNKKHRLENALNYVYESGYLRNEAYEKARWGLGFDVDCEQVVAALQL